MSNRRRGPKRMTVTHPKVKRLLFALRLGDFVEEACAHAHISQDTYYRWLREGNEVERKALAGHELDETESKIAELSEAIKDAELEGQHQSLALIRKAATEGTWQAAAWFLERRNKKWSNRTEITGPNEGPVQVTFDREEVTKRMLEWLREMKSDDDSDEDSAEPTDR